MRAMIIGLLLLSILISECGGGEMEPTIKLKTKPHGQFDQEQASWQGIIPGLTTEDQVVSRLGEPLKIDIKEDRHYYLYPASEGGDLFRNSIGVIDGRVVAMLIYPSAGAYSTLDQVMAEYGAPEEVTFSHFDRGTKVYVFASAGLAVTAYDRDGVITQSLYFVQMSLDEYLNSYGLNLPKTDPFRE